MNVTTDRRRVHGSRVVFDTHEQPDAYWLARLLAKRLSAERAHQLRLLAEEMLIEDANRQEAAHQ
jgi:hypothetical protein